MIKTAVL